MDARIRAAQIDNRQLTSNLLGEQGGIFVKKRSSTVKQGRSGIIAVEQACNDLDLIWRSLLEEDVGVDGTIEIALGEFPTGKIIGAQVKSGTSYIRSETETSFRFYPDKDDLDYWRKLSIPLFLLIHLSLGT